MTKNKPNRILGLDILRAIAILLVLYRHGKFYIEQYINISLYNLFCADGVTLFFVLSGFLIGSILLKTIESKDFNVTELKNFWIRRWFRTLPNYFLVLLVLIAYYAYTAQALPSGVFKYLIFMQNFSAPAPDFFNESWSLAVEEWFYIIVPFVLAISLGLFKNCHRKNIILATIAGCIIVVHRYV